MHRSDMLYLLATALGAALVYYLGYLGWYSESGIFIALLASTFPATMAMVVGAFRETDTAATGHAARAWLGLNLLLVIVASISYNNTPLLPRLTIAAISAYVVYHSLQQRRARLQELAAEA